MRTSIDQNIGDIPNFKQRLLQWAQQFTEITYLDSNDFPHLYSKFDCILAVDAFTSLRTDYHNAFEDLKQYQQTTQDWLFGYLSYDLKNGIEALSSANFDGLDFPDLFFYQPKKLFLLQGDTVTMLYLKMCDDELLADFEQIKATPLKKEYQEFSLIIEQRIQRDQYLEKVQNMLQHIRHGDIYEANFCMEFYTEDAHIEPLHVFQRLNSISEPPFATFVRHKHHYIVSASPERYLKKSGSTLISQPIKGTARRSKNAQEDDAISQQLSSSEKERAENIMIVDLVRNDLSKTAARASVHVEELCGVYAFRQVHHLVSTVVSEMDSQYSPVDALQTTFPMGSMTGAPKISAMKIIEKLEETKRGIYSGSVGYFTPEGDFDFNVIIRSILYNQRSRYLSFSVGSAITAEADPASEYEECLLKAKAMFDVLS